jgi:hypothetical protein
MKKKQDIPSALLRENPNRGVFLPYEITENTYGELAPRITQLRSSNQPIEVDP